MSDFVADPVADAKAEKLAQKDAVLRAALPNIPFDGWGMATLEAAAEKAGLGRVDAHRLFPAGAKDAVAHFRNLADRLMREDLARLDLAGMKIRERIATGGAAAPRTLDPLPRGDPAPRSPSVRCRPTRGIR